MVTCRYHIRHLSEPEFGRGKKIYIWANGDIYNNIYNVFLNPNRLRTWNAILFHITNKVRPNFGAVHSLVSIKSKKRVVCFADLENQGKYIAVGLTRLRFDRYNNITKSDFKVKKKRIKKFYSGDIDVSHKTFWFETKKRKLTVIFILVNGRICQMPSKVVLTETDKEMWDMVLEYLAKILDIPDGIPFLYTIYGDIILDPEELQHGYLYVAVPFNEKFKKMEYVEMFNQWEAEKKYGHQQSIRPASLKFRETKKGKRTSGTSDKSVKCKDTTATNVKVVEKKNTNEIDINQKNTQSKNKTTLEHQNIPAVDLGEPDVSAIAVSSSNGTHEKHNTKSPKENISISRDLFLLDEDNSDWEDSLSEDSLTLVKVPLKIPPPISNINYIDKSYSFSLHNKNSKDSNSNTDHIKAVNKIKSFTIHSGKSDVIANESCPAGNRLFCNALNEVTSESNKYVFEDQNLNSEICVQTNDNVPEKKDVGTEYTTDDISSISGLILKNNSKTTEVLSKIKEISRETNDCEVLPKIDNHSEKYVHLIDTTLEDVSECETCSELDNACCVVEDNCNQNNLENKGQYQSNIIICREIVSNIFEEAENALVKLCNTNTTENENVPQDTDDDYENELSDKSLSENKSTNNHNGTDTDNIKPASTSIINETTSDQSKNPYVKDCKCCIFCAGARTTGESRMRQRSRDYWGCNSGSADEKENMLYEE